jgi:hypothetical protein
MDSTDNEKIISDGLEALYNIGEERAQAIEKLKAKLLFALKSGFPEILEADKKANIEIGKIEKAALELGKSTQCKYGRVTYFEAWAGFEAGVDIEGIKKRNKDNFDLADLLEELKK